MVYKYKSIKSEVLDGAAGPLVVKTSDFILLYFYTMFLYFFIFFILFYAFYTLRRVFILFDHKYKNTT